MGLAEDYEYDPEDYLIKSWHSPRKERDNNLHHTKDKKKMLIKDMDDSHLFNTYMKIGGKDYFNEMVIRLFEERLKG